MKFSKNLGTPEQCACAKQVLCNIKEKTIFQLVISQTQSGKTGMMVSIAKQCNQNVIVMTGLSSSDWKRQTISRFPNNVPVYHRNDLKNLKSLKNCVVLIDEVQYGTGIGMTLDNMMERCGIKDLEMLAYYNVFFVCVSATPNKIFNDILLLSEKIKCKVLSMETGKKYFGLKDYVEKGRIFDALCLKSEENVKKLKEFVENNYKENVYVVIRTPSALEGENVRELVKAEFGEHYDYIICDMTTKKNAMTVLTKKPIKTTIVFIKEQLRCAATLCKTYLGVLYERVSKMDNVMVQGLAGRGTGYDVPDRLVVFTNMKCIMRYIEDFENIKNSGNMTMLHPNSFNEMSVSSVDSDLESI